MTEVDRHCRRLRVGAVPWSPIIQRRIDAVTYWTLRIKHLQLGKVSARLLRRLRAKAQEVEESTTVKQAKGHLRRAAQQYRLAKAEAASLRRTWLEELADARAVSYGGTSAQHMQAILKRERNRLEARACRRAIGRVRGNVLTTVSAPEGSGQWTEPTTRQAIEEACLQENRQRFQQAANTPFLQPPLSELLDPEAAGEFASSISQGTCRIPLSLDRYTSLFLQAIRRPGGTPLFSTNLDLDEYRWRWHRAREYTATACSGLHFGHFKAGAQHPQIAQFELDMISLPFRHGFTPQRWAQALDVALPKSQDKTGGYSTNDYAL